MKQEEGSVEAPPTYEEASDPNAAPPPSYDSLYGKVKDAQKSSTGFLDFFKKFIALLLGTIGFTIIQGIRVIIPICMIALGTVNLHKCPAEPYIPIYLIVAGVFGVLKDILNWVSRYRKRNTAESDEDQSVKPSALDGVINCFLFAWFIAGCVWIYRIYEPEYADSSSDRYCNKTLYLFSFWLVTLVYVILGLVVGFICCTAIVCMTVLRQLEE